MLNDLQKCIDELLDCNAFELQLHTDEDGLLNCYIPYMMNDALECYFVLKDCKITGEVVTGVLNLEKIISVELIYGNHLNGFFIRLANGNVSTLWFQDISKELKCYQYHEIGHFWVKGQEHLRQLVYMVGTIYDKFEYLGESICNTEELSLLPLMEFAPFRYWSPIHESLDAHYPDTADGVAYFKNLCIEAGDSQLLQLAERYEKITCSSLWLTKFHKKFTLPGLVKKIALELVSSGHEKLYELIYQKVCEASLKYPRRDYGDEMNAYIAKSRQDVVDSLISRGFFGEYPRFSSSDDDRYLSVLVTEEHPFTLSALEYENYEFRIQMMVSESKSKIKYLNQGFFVSKNSDTRGWIAKSVNEITA